MIDSSSPHSDHVNSFKLFSQPYYWEQVIAIWIPEDHQIFHELDITIFLYNMKVGNEN